MKPCLLILITCLGILIGCNSPNNIEDKAYYALWASTTWEIELARNGSFKYIFLGHYTHDTLYGTYNFKGDTLTLTPDFMEEGYERDIDIEFLLIDQNCLVGLNTGYDYCDNRTDDWCSRKWDLNDRKVIEDCYY